MSIGQKVIEGLTKGDIIRGICAHDEDHPVVIVFSANADEQIEAIVAQAAVDQVITAKTIPQPNGCTCYGTPPTVPVFRDANDHLDGCPAKRSADLQKEIEYLREVRKENSQTIHDTERNSERQRQQLDYANFRVTELQKEVDRLITELREKEEGK